MGVASRDATEVSMAESQNKKRIIYTALMGRYEEFRADTPAISTESDLVCFTDNPSLRSDVWSVELIKPRFEDDSIRSARYIKIMGPAFLAGYDESLWLDNSVLLRASPDALMDRFIHDVDFALPLHSFRHTVAAEFDAVAESGLDDFSRVYEQMIHYATSSAQVLDERPYWTAILARKHNSTVVELMNRWWEHVLRYSRRDQLSLNYVLQGHRIALRRIDIDNYDSEYHQWPIGTNRRMEIKRSNSLYDAYRSMPQARLARLQSECDKLRRELERTKDGIVRRKVRKLVRRLMPRASE
jgi:hypothetical protein